MPTEMNNQAAQTMPDIDAIVRHAINEHCPNGKWLTGTNTLAMAITSEVTAALSQTAGVPDGWRSTVEALVRHIESETCTHEETHRGGAIWEICDSCGAQWADDRGGRPEFTWPECVENARAMLAAAPAASGGEDELDRAARRMGDSARALLRDIAEQQAAASVSERARELLAAEYSKCGMQQCAADIRSGVFAAAQQLAVNAIKAALEQKVPSGEVAIVCDWRGADPFPTFIEAEVGGKSVSLEWRDRPDGLKELIVPATDSALRALEQALTQPSDAQRERDLLAEAIGNAGIKCGLLRKDIEGLTGPQLLMVCDDMAEALTQQRGVQLGDFQDKAMAWDSVCEILHIVHPNWHANGRTGMQAAVNTIRSLATTTPQPSADAVRDEPGNDPRVDDDSFTAAIRACRSQIGARRPDDSEPEEQWMWDKLTKLESLLGRGG